MRFTLNGDHFDLDRSVVEAKLAGHEPEAIRAHWVEINGQRWPPKQALELVIGVHRSEFTSHTPLRQFERLGFPTSTIPTAGLYRSAPDDMTVSAAQRASQADTTSATAAFATLLSFIAAENLTTRVSHLEARLKGVDQPQAAAVLRDSDLSPDLLRAALLVRRHAGRLSDVIHAAVIAQTLPLILEDDEHVIVRPSLAAGNDPSRPFDVETDRRVAEFKVSLWKGADAMRKRGAFQDLVHLALDQSGRRAQLFVAGDHAIRFLRTATSSADWGLNRASPKLRARFEERFGSLQVRICDFTNGPALHVELIDLTELLPTLGGD